MTRWSLFLFSTFLIASTGFCQEKALSIRFENASIEACLERLSEHSGYLFSYNPDNFPKQARITKAYRDQPLQTILQDLLQPYHLEYSIMQNMVIVTGKKRPENIPVNTSPTSAPPITPDESPPSALRDSVILVYDTVTTEKIIYDTIRHTVTEKYYDTTTVVKTLSPYELKPGAYSLVLSGGLALPILQQKANDQSDELYSLSGAPVTIVGLRLFFERQKIGLGAGLEYSGLRFGYTHLTDTFQTYYEIDTTGSYYIIVNGEPRYFYVVDSTEHQVHVSYAEEKTIDCQRLSIPLRLTYRVDFGAKFSAWIGGEGILSLLIYEKTQNTSPEINTNPYFDYAFLTQIGYKPAFNSVVFVEARYRGRSGSFLNNASYKTAFMELNAGVRIFFNH